MKFDIHGGFYFYIKREMNKKNVYNNDYAQGQAAEAQGRAAQAQANAQAQALEQNAEFSRAQAHDAIERGGQEELKLRRNIQKHLGNQRASLATNEVDINSGSALDVRNASISEGEYDAETIRFNAARQRWGYLNQAENQMTQAANARAQGEAAASQGKAAARNALFGGVVNAGLGIASGYQTSKSSPLTQTTISDYNFYRDDANFNSSLSLATRFNNNKYNPDLYKWNKTTGRIK